VRITGGGFLVANAGPDQTLDATAALTPVTLDGSGSSTDAAGAPLRFRWQEGTTVLATTDVPPTTVRMAPGVHALRLVVTNNRGETASDDVVITVRNTLPPSIRCPENIVRATNPGVCGAPAPTVNAPQSVASGVHLADSHQCDATHHRQHHAQPGDAQAAPPQAGAGEASRP
jgi:hypothetical protein